MYTFPSTTSTDPNKETIMFNPDDLSTWTTEQLTAEVCSLRGKREMALAGFNRLTEAMKFVQQFIEDIVDDVNDEEFDTLSKVFKDGILADPRRSTEIIEFLVTVTRRVFVGVTYAHDIDRQDVVDYLTESLEDMDIDDLENLSVTTDLFDIDNVDANSIDTEVEES